MAIRNFIFSFKAVMGLRITYRMLLLVVIVWLSGLNAAAQSKPSARLDSVLASLSHLPDTVRVDSLIKLARLSSLENDHEFSLEQARVGHNMANRYGYFGLRAKARFYVAYSFQLAQQLDSCRWHYEACLQELKGTAFEGWENYVYGNMAYIHQDFGLYEKALTYQLRSLDYSVARNDTPAYPRIYTSIGFTYDRLGDYPKAIEWHRKAIPFLRYLQDSSAYYTLMGDIGICFDELGLYDSAHYYNGLSLSYSEAVGDEPGIRTNLSNIGNTFLKQQQWSEALPLLERAQQLAAKLEAGGNPTIRLSIVYLNLGAAYFNLNRMEEALNSYRKGLQLAQANHETKFSTEAFELLYRFYQANNNADSALHYLQLYTVLNDSLYNLEMVEQVANMQAKYETEQKENQLLQQEVELERRQRDLDAQDAQIAGLVALSITLLLVGLLYYQYYRNRQKREMQEAVVREREKGIDQIFEAIDGERARIAKDLHDGLGQQLSLIKMRAQGFSSARQPSEASLRDLDALIDATAQEARNISHQMMPKALTQLGLLAAMSDLMGQLASHSSMAVHFEHFNLRERYPEKVEIAMYRVCQELISNTVKHAQATELSVQLYQQGSELVLMVEDNGKGFDTEAVEAGLGLANIRNRITNLKGRCNITSSEAGTAVMASIPATGIQA